MDSSLILAGFGGQGIISAGQILAQAFMLEGLEITWLPAYGAEMRGGTVNCTLAFSDEEVASAYIEIPETAIVMNLPSFERFESQVKAGGLIIANSTLIDATPRRDDIKYVFAPFTQIANDLGNIRVANIVSLGAFLALKEFVKIENVMTVLQDVFSSKGMKIVDLNINALKKGYEYCVQQTNSKQLQSVL